MNKQAKSKNNIDIRLNTIDNTRKVINVESEKFRKLNDMLVTKFGLQKDGDLVHDIVGDEGFQNYKKDHYKISIGWEPFFPVYIMAINSESNELIEDIFEWLKNIEIPK